jgi:hypothetical protein
VKNLIRSSIAPLSAFIMAVLLSITLTAQPGRPARPQAAQTQDCDCNTKMDNLKAVAQAQKWKPSTPGGGTLEIRGKFDTHVNTEQRHIGEFVYLTLTISVTDIITGETKTAKVMGKVRKAMRTLDGSPTCFKVVDDTVKIGEEGKGISLDDDKDVSAAIKDGAGLIPGVTPEDPEKPASNEGGIRTLLGQRIELLYEVQMGGFPKERPNLPCPSRLYGSALLELKDGNGAQKLAEVNKPKGIPPF